jgi:hypothetical protein
MTEEYKSTLEKEYQDQIFEKIKKELQSHKKELLKADIRKAQNYFIFFLLGFISALVIEKFL